MGFHAINKVCVLTHIAASMLTHISHMYGHAWCLRVKTRTQISDFYLKKYVTHDHTHAPKSMGSLFSVSDCTIISDFFSPFHHSNLTLLMGSLFSVFNFQMVPFSYRKMDFEEFCNQHVWIGGPWQIGAMTFEYFEQEGNKVISVEELARVHTFIALRVFYNWIVLLDLNIYWLKRS